MNVTFEIKTLRGRWAPRPLDPEAILALDNFLRPHDLTGRQFLATLPGLCASNHELPWAVILWPQDYPVSGELAERRYTYANMPMSSYAWLKTGQSGADITIPTSIMLVRRKAILEHMARHSSLLTSAWALLKDCSPRRPWLCLCDGPDRLFTPEDMQADATRYREAMNRAPMVPGRPGTYLDSSAVQLNIELLKTSYDTGCLDLACRIREGLCRQMPDDPWMWLCLGECLYAARRNEEAVSIFARALDMVPNWLRARWGIVKARWAGHLNEAGPELDRLLDTDPFEESFLEPRIDGYAHRITPAEYAHAEALNRRYIALQPDSGRALLNLATLLCYQADFDAAIPLLRRAVMHIPHNFAAWNNLAFAQAALGINLAAATYACQRALDLDSRSYHAWDTLGVIAMKRGRFSDARAAFETALRFNPDAADTRANLAAAQQRIAPPQPVLAGTAYHPSQGATTWRPTN